MNFENEIINLRQQGIGYKRIGKMLNIPITKVSDILIKNNFITHIVMPEEKTVSKIIKMYTEEKLGTISIAKKMNMSANRVANILKVKNIKLTPKSYHSNYDSKVDHNYFEIIDDEHKAYWLGMLYADGYNNEKYYQIELSLKRSDRYILECFKNDIKNVYKIKDKNVSLNGKIFPQCRITIYSKKISQDLVKLGCTQRKSLTINFPSSNIVPQKFINHFMRGYFDGNGCISKSKFMLNGTKSFLLKYIEILRQNTNISGAETWSMDGQSFRWIHSSKKDAIKIYDFLYKDSTIFLKRKSERFLKNK